MSSDNASSVVTHTSISSYSDGPSWGIPLMNAGELPEMDPYEEPVYPEYNVLSDDDIQIEDQPYAADASPSALSSGYISSDDDEDDDDDVEEEDEHLALADFVLSLVYHTTARMSIRPQMLIPFPSEVEVDRLLAISTPPPSPLTSYSSPLPQIPPTSLPASPTNPLGYRAVMIRLRAKSDVPEVTLPHRKRLCIASDPRFKVGECSSAPTARPTRGFRADYGFVATLDAEIRRDPEREIGYGITDVWVDPDEIAEEILATDVAELSQRMTDFVTTVIQDTNEIYERLNDAQDDRLLMSGQLNLLRKDKRAHAHTT
nr:hypothetical protein [Tanacetum cinerariifolium]